MDIGGVESEKEKAWTPSNVWEVEGYVDDDGNWWSEEQWNLWGYEQEPGNSEDVNAVNKGKEKENVYNATIAVYLGTSLSTAAKEKAKAKGTRRMGDAFHTDSTRKVRAMAKEVTVKGKTKAQEVKVDMSHSLTGSVTNADKRVTLQPTA